MQLGLDESRESLLAPLTSLPSWSIRPSRLSGCLILLLNLAKLLGDPSNVQQLSGSRLLNLIHFYC
jgi:hypothetical protein